MAQVFRKYRKVSLILVAAACWMTALMVILFRINEMIWKETSHMQITHSHSHHESHQYRGQCPMALRTNAGNRVYRQLSFNISKTLLTSLGFPIDKFSSITSNNSDEFVFVTAASDNHFDESLDAIVRLQLYFPLHTIYFYDLSIKTSLSRVNKLKSLCNVNYRKFRFDKYPNHVQQLLTYSWKPLIIHEILREYSSVFYLDSSIRFTSSNVCSVLRRTVITSCGAILFASGNHSIFAATHFRMYKYLPITRQAAINVTMWNAGAVYLHRSLEVYTNVIRWWFLCSLDENCIAPSRRIECRFHGRDRYANCHRFDQSAINILLSNFFENNEDRYTSRHSMLDVRRTIDNTGVLQVCQPRRQSCRTPVDFFSNVSVICETRS